MEDKKKDQNGDDNDDDFTPLEKTMLDQFTADMLKGCLEVLTGMPGTVFKACDVLSVVAQRNGEEWKESTMMHVLKQVLCFVLAYSKNMENNNTLSKKLYWQTHKHVPISQTSGKWD